MILDLHNLSPEDSKKLDKISIEIQEDFNKLTEKILNSTDKTIANLVGNVVSRHTYQSKLFEICAYSEFVLQKLQESSNIFLIITNNKDLSLILKKYCVENNINIRIKTSAKLFNTIKERVKSYLYLIKYLIMSINNLYVKDEERLNNIINEKNVIIIDNFLQKNSLKEKIFIDRYFLNILNFVDIYDRSKIFFFPTILGYYNKNIINEIYINSKENLIFDFDFLSFYDYVNIFYLLLKNKIRKDKKFIFKKFDLSNYIIKTSKLKRFTSSTVIGVTKYFVIKKMKEKDVSIKLVIDWNENQPIDKGLIKGCHDFYPDVLVKGYQGFIISTDYNFYLLPTEFEINNGVIPDKITVIGKKLIYRIKKFTTNIEVEVGPAFRFYRDNINLDENLKRHRNNILLILPIGIEDSSNLYFYMLEVIKSLKGRYKFYLKLHPDDSMKEFLNKIGNNYPPNVIFENGKYDAIIRKVSTVIGHTTTGLMEALLYGIPVIIVGNPTGITQNPIPPNITKLMWRLCYTEQEIKEAIFDFSEINEEMKIKFKNIGNIIRKEYFCKPNERNVKRFLELN